MAGLSDNFEIGVGRKETGSASAPTVPSIPVALISPHTIEITKARTPIAETGITPSKFVGQHVETKGMGSTTINFYARPSVLAFFIGTVNNKALNTSPTILNDSKTYTIGTDGDAPGYTVIPEFYLFTKGDGTINRYNAIAKKVTVNGSQNGMVEVSVDICYHNEVKTGITFPTSNTERGQENMFSSSDFNITSLTGINLPGTDKAGALTNKVDEFTFEIDSGVSDLVRKGGNTFRAEGGASVTTIEIKQTQEGTTLRDIWESSNPNDIEMTFSIKNHSGRSVEFPLGELFLMSRDLDRPLNEVSRQSNKFVKQGRGVVEVKFVVPSQTSLITT